MTGQLDRIIELEKLYNKSKTKSSSKIVAIASGKGGTGKTFFAANWAYHLSNSKKVLLVDLDFNLANVHLLFNSHPQKTLTDYFESRCIFKDVITKYNSNLHLIYGEAGYSERSVPAVEKINKMFNEINKLSDRYDIILLDLGAGISKENIYVLTHSDIKIIVATPEPTSLMDAYVVIKQLKFNSCEKNIFLAINRVVELNEAEQAFDNLKSAVDHFLKTKIEFLVNIPESMQIRRSIIEQNLYTEHQKNDDVFRAFVLAERRINKINQVLNINHSSLVPSI